MGHNMVTCVLWDIVSQALLRRILHLVYITRKTMLLPSYEFLRLVVFQFVWLHIVLV